MANSYVNTNAPVSAGERKDPIKINTTSLADMVKRGPAYVEHVAQSSPVQIDRLFGVKTGAEADMALAAAANARRGAAPRQASPAVAAKAATVDSMFARGDVLFDTEFAKKVTVLNEVGQTKKGTPIYKVVDGKGNAWRQTQKRLTRN